MLSAICAERQNYSDEIIFAESNKGEKTGEELSLVKEYGESTAQYFNSLCSFLVPQHAQKRRTHAAKHSVGNAC
ncbi:MAG: hypothetical protein RR193_02575 [Christensenellaceae bacterium]